MDRVYLLLSLITITQGWVEDLIIPDWRKEIGERSAKGREVVDHWWETVTTEEKIAATRRRERSNQGGGRWRRERDGELPSRSASRLRRDGVKTIKTQQVWFHNLSKQRAQALRSPKLLS